MSTEALMEPSAAAQGGPRPVASSPPHKSPSPPSSTSLASHLLAAVSQVQSLTSQLPPSVPLPTSSPSGLGHYRHGMLGGGIPHQFHLGSDPPMSSLLAGLKDFPRQYHSPPPVPSSESHECKIVDYRGAKVAAFIINGDTMLCLPQAFEIFLKHLVGGLHTVYTKLKRLGIEPLVCNVDQVRILRGLGAIQPGVNRCKLLCIKHFDILYKDCTTARLVPYATWRGGQREELLCAGGRSVMADSLACSRLAELLPTPTPTTTTTTTPASSLQLENALLTASENPSRPGRPPKRASDFMTMAPSPDALFDLKKRHLENGGFHNGQLPVFPFDFPGDHRLDKSPLLANGYHAPPHFNPLQYMAHHMGLGYPPLMPGGLPGGLPGGHPVGHHPLSPNDASPLKHPHITPETLARLALCLNPCRMHEERVERERQLALEQRHGLTPTSIAGGHPPMPPTSTQDSDHHHHHHHPPTSPVLNLSKGGAPSDEGHDDRDDDREHDLASHDSAREDLHDDDRRTNQHDDVDRLSDMDDDEDKDESMDIADAWARASSNLGQTQLSSPPGAGGPGATMGIGGSAPLSSTEVLLRNILGLLRVAEENARHHERQTQYEKAELKMEVLRERELRETLEKQLQEEQKNRILMQKRCAKLKKLRRRLQERLDVEVKRRSRYEDHLRSNSPDALGDINDTIRKEMEAIAAELKNESFKTVQQQVEERDTVDRLLASPALANHPAITAATAKTTAAWR
ncbi:dachshund homolog 2-like isoform X3 [Palaemon carinicauda]|uniref:dachshund homolog 2-like isoform X3 n=1 Tax=Palaemon carinicauda TaxID=392227 RepID=UPI0035B6A11F